MSADNPTVDEIRDDPVPDEALPDDDTELAAPPPPLNQKAVEPS